MLRCRRSELCSQPRRTSHHQIPHTGRLSAIAQMAIITGPNRPANTEAITGEPFFDYRAGLVPDTFGETARMARVQRFS